MSPPPVHLGKTLVGVPRTSLLPAGCRLSMRMESLFLKAGLMERKSTISSFPWYDLLSSLSFLHISTLTQQHLYSLSQYCPQVRDVSNRILATPNADVESDPIYTFLVTIFSQWTDHDLTFTPQSPSIRSFNMGIDCDKTCTNTEPCYPIKVSGFNISLISTSLSN